MGDVARKAAVSTIVVIAIVAVALALWKLKIVIALVFLGFIVAAAVRPGVERLAEWRIPRPAGVLVHYLAVAGAIALLLWLVVPRAVDQVGHALGSVPTSRQELKQQAKHSTGIKHELLAGVQKRLKRLPKAGSLIHGAVAIGVKAFEVLIGILFVFATAAYWIFERERAIRLVTSLVPRKHRRVVRDTWELIDLKLGAFVRGQLLLIAFVATVLSLCFWGMGLPFWLLIGVAAGIVEIIPVIGPIAAGALAVGVGLTQSWHLALAAGIAVLAVRLLEDYVVIPRVMGHVTGISPLLVLVGVTAIGLLFGGFYVLLATPLLAVLVTLVDVIVRDKDPAEEDVPAVLFAKESTGR
ncbi:MAG: AI-2E family transporter [Actinobacteria bacterium]|nr:MAG: AI-2E family transporter [Actinomycetota bacterium]